MTKNFYFLVFLLAQTALAEDGVTKTALSLFETGGPLMYPLALCSFAIVWLTIYNACEIRKGKFTPDGDVKMLTNFLYEHEEEKALSFAAGGKSQLLQVIAPAIEKVEAEKPETRPLAEAAVQEAWDENSVKILFWLNLLSTIAALSPMLGLLGTVSGMIKAFSKIGLGGMGKPELLAGDIGEALITTAAGLIVGIPAMVFYFILRSRLDRQESHLFRVVTELLDLAYNQKAARSRASKNA